MSPKEGMTKFAKQAKVKATWCVGQIKNKFHRRSKPENTVDGDSVPKCKSRVYYSPQGTRSVNPNWAWTAGKLIIN